MKQAILVRLDLKMPKGKMATQVAHASVEGVMASGRSKVQDWISKGSKKVVLKVPDRGKLIHYKKLAEKAGLATALIRDAGRTFFKKPTITCLAIGPDDEEEIDKIVGHLKLI
jgi:PTH2 family peptidyl-tRNA hydrolase